MSADVSSFFRWLKALKEDMQKSIYNIPYCCYQLYGNL